MGWADGWHPKSWALKPVAASYNALSYGVRTIHKNTDSKEDIDNLKSFGGGTARRHADEATAAKEAAAKAAEDKAQGERDKFGESVEKYLDRIYKDNAPYREYGLESLRRLRELESNPELVTKQPGYQEGLRHITGTVNAQASATGDVMGGARQKRLTRYASDYYSQKYGEHWKRLASGAGIGEAAVARQGGAGATALSAEGRLTDANIQGIRNLGSAEIGGINESLANESAYRQDSMDALRFFTSMAGGATGVFK
jgi:hypothetical protein